MRPQSLLFLLSSVALASVLKDRDAAENLAIRDPAPIPHPEPIPAPAELVARKCDYNGCTCKKAKKKKNGKDVKAGKYCGYESNVLTLGIGGALDHIYQCAKDGDCCDYGFAKDCERD